MKLLNILFIFIFMFGLIATNVYATTYVLPSEDGNAGQTLVTDGNGNVTWQYGGNVYIKLDQSDVNLHVVDTNIQRTYHNIDKEDITTKWLLGLLFALVGMMIFFDTFFNDRFKRYI